MRPHELEISVHLFSHPATFVVESFALKSSRARLQRHGKSGCSLLNSTAHAAQSQLRKVTAGLLLYIVRAETTGSDLIVSRVVRDGRRRQIAYCVFPSETGVRVSDRSQDNVVCKTEDPTVTQLSL